MSSKQPSYVNITTRGGITILALNRPPVNALSRALLEELTATLEHLASDSTVRVVILASALPHFSAGADLQEMKALASPKDVQTFITVGQKACNTLESIPQPVIAAVEGVAMGGGCELALACDLRVAGQSARFGQTEVNLGIVPGWGGSQRLPRLIGRGMGTELLLTGEAVTADRALALGLVNRVAPAGQALAEAQRMAEALLAKPPLSLKWIKQEVHQGLEQPLTKGLDMEAELFLQARASQDAQEGIQAFLEKRQPRFRGS